jgi:hypothetical protein
MTETEKAKNTPVMTPVSRTAARLDTTVNA